MSVVNEPLQTQERVSPKTTSVAGDSFSVVVQDVEHFARTWIGRARQIFQRTSQLIERESLLAGAIAKLDQQKSEWIQRTREKEAGLMEQSKMLTEAWLEVEAQRRKAAQGVRSGQNTGRVVRPVGAPPVVAPAVVVEPARMPGNVAEPLAAAPESVVSTDPSNTVNPGDVAGGENPNAVVATQGPIANAPVMPVTASPVDSVTNIPVNTSASLHPADQASEEPNKQAANRERIDEFKRMQRALRSNRNR